VELLVRTWNLFHGRTFPETRHAHVERMVRLVATGEPGVVCLQEVPLWALGRLEGWSGMSARAARTKTAWLGPVAGLAQRVDARRVRSPWTGQANAVLVARGLEIVSASAERLSERRERRVCQLVRLRGEPGELLVANVHLTNRRAEAASELDRVAALLEQERPVVLCGDLNLEETGLPGFSEPIPGIDQILVRGAELVGAARRWPDERRRLGDRLLSDHAPLEAAMMWR
jgi:endonuclease/exonuclease/phosphatase family metal-dependent hydrolase